MATTATPVPGKRRVRKRILIPALLVGFFLLVLVVLVVRGSWADEQERNPATVAQGTITQLYRTPEGKTPVRCAIVVPASASFAWQVVTDYENHARFMPYVSQLSSRELKDGRTHIEGVAHSRIWGDWPFQSTVSHEEKGQTYRAWWEESDHFLAVNRGSWQVSSTKDGESLVVFSLEIEVAGYPNFLIRNILMDRLHTVLQALREEVQRRKANPS
jgi:ribosome-associated toxin RatA of RatAB toxin-antitoxin module